MKKRSNQKGADIDRAMALLAQLERALDQDEEELEDSPIRQFEIEDHDSKEVSMIEVIDEHDTEAHQEVLKREGSFTEQTEQRNNAKIIQEEGHVSNHDLLGK